jgi:hypothetical protein
MSTDHPDGATEAHLDSEAVSAALDGEGTAVEAAHLDGCAACRAQVQALRDVQALVAASTPPVPADVRDAAIAAALDAWEPAPASGGEVADLATLRARRRPTARWPVGPLLGVAAVLLLVALAVPLLAGLGEEQADQSASGAADTDESFAAEDETTALAAPDQGAIDVGDLGTIERGADLRAVVDGASRARDDLSITSGTALQARPEGDLEDSAPATGGEATGESGAAGGGAAATQRSLEAALPCVEPVRAELGELGPLVLAGTATVEERDGLVLGFQSVGTDRPTVLVVLVATDGCELLTFQSYATG